MVIEKIKTKLKTIPHIAMFVLICFFLQSCMLTNNYLNKNGIEMKIGNKNINDNRINTSNKQELKVRNNTVEIISRDRKLERRWYSPNGLNYIRQTTDGQIDEDDNTYWLNLYLNQDNTIVSKILLYDLNEIDLLNKSMVWINNEDILIDGQVIYNINSGKERIIKFPDNNRHYVVNYSVNRDVSKVAYATVGNYDITIYVYNIKEDNWITVYYGKLEEIGGEANRSEYNIFWDYEDNIYFETDAYSNIKKEYINIINIYNSRDNVLKNYTQEKDLFYCSPDNRYIVIKDFDQNESIIIDTKISKNYIVKLTEKIFFNPLGNGFFYISENTKNEQSRNLTIVEFKDNKQLDEHNLDISYLEKDFNEFFNFRWENNRVLFDVIKYDNENRDFKEFITYAIYE